MMLPGDVWDVDSKLCHGGTFGDSLGVLVRERGSVLSEPH